MSQFQSFNGLNVLVTGGTGMIGRSLTRKLIDLGANVTIASIDTPHSNDSLLTQVKFIYADLRNFSECKTISFDKDIVFHLAGIKGSPKLTQSQPATFFTNTMMFNLNMMEAARLAGVEKYLFTSSIGVYAPAQVFREDDVWQTFPSENDRFAGYAKRMGELQAQAYSIEYNWNAVSIVRPSNVYGFHDNFDPNTGMVIPSLIARFASSENPIRVWGDGSAVRDFIFADDVADGMLTVVDSQILEPINIGSGKGIKISEVVDILKENFPEKEVIWDSTMPKGDDVRIMDTTKALELGITPRISLKEGITSVVNWYLEKHNAMDKRYNAFNEHK